MLIVSLSSEVILDILDNMERINTNTYIGKNNIYWEKKSHKYMLPFTRIAIRVRYGYTILEAAEIFFQSIEHH